MINSSVDGASDFAPHGNPVWREQSDFIIHAAIPDSESPRWEQLWVQRLDENEFRICCIPFFIYDLALGDVVSVRETTQFRFLFDRVLKPSGHTVFRVWLGDSSDDPKGLIHSIANVGGLVERYSDNLFGVDVYGAEQTREMANFLESLERAKALVFETGASYFSRWRL